MDENSNFRKENEGELSAFSTEHLTVGYDKMPLIKDVNLQVRPGEILTLIGPNGSGKSTILKTITRQLKQIGGTVYLGKETMRGMGDNEVSRRLSMVMTERVRTELMSGREVVASGRYPYTGRLGILSPEDWEKVDEAIALVHAKEVQEQDFMKISDGQRQRLMLARAIAQDTKILVLDEPTSYLDMGFKLDILANIRLLARERNLAIVMSLHELDLAQKISDTIACVKGDRIDRIGTPEEIFAGDYVQKLYGVAKENFDPLTGQVFFPKNAQAPKVFVIGGGGAGIPVYHCLQRQNIPFAAGILQENPARTKCLSLLLAFACHARCFQLNVRSMTQLRRTCACQLLADKALPSLLLMSCLVLLEAQCCKVLTGSMQTPSHSMLL